jgi:tetratricopeptide (TPR) repeat protein
VAYSRQVGDAHYAGYAEAVIEPWMNQPAPPAGVLVMQATILQYRHQFSDARDLLRGALAVDPRNGQAWLTLATLDMVQGDYKSAGRNCAQAASTAGVDLGLACTGNLRSYIGQAHQSLVMLHQAELSAAKLPAAYQAWLQGLIAESAERLGDWRLAETHYLNALRLLPQDNFLAVAYADFLLDRGRPNEVLALLAQHMQSDTAFLRLALAQSALHSAEVSRYTWIMAARFEALSLRGSDYFGREQARFALQLQHDPRTALEMARRNWQLQRAPWDARVFLEAALAAQQPDAAAQVLDFLRDTKLEDPIIDPLADRLREQIKSSGGSR